MIIVFVTLIIVAIALFVVSYFLTDKVDDLEEQFEQFTISTQQDTYQLNRKMRILEKQLKDQSGSSVVEDNVANEQINESINPIVMQKVKHLHEQGYSVEDIMKQTDLSTAEVNYVLTKHLNR